MVRKWWFSMKLCGSMSWTERIKAKSDVSRCMPLRINCTSTHSSWEDHRMMPCVILCFVTHPMAPPPPQKTCSATTPETPRLGYCYDHQAGPHLVIFSLFWHGQEWCGSLFSNIDSHQKSMYKILLQDVARSSSISKRYQSVIGTRFRHKKHDILSSIYKIKVYVLVNFQ